MMDLIVLIASLAGLWWGTELSVRAALRIAESRGLSQAFVGMTVLAIGTDVPEMVMAIVAAVGRLQGVEASGLVLGSAIGSCMGQIAMVLGVAGLSGYLTLGAKRVWADGTMVLGSIIVFALVCLDGEVSRVEGGILLTSYVVYFISLIRRERAPAPKSERRIPCLKDFGKCAVGLVLVTGFSHACIRSALALAESWDLGQTLIGVLIVGLGTSLPELALSLGAVRRKAGALSVGNILGSNVFDMLVPPGAAALIAGINADIPGLLNFDIPALTFVSVAALVFFLRKRGLQKLEAWTLLFLYITYVTARILWV
ncbi:MAG: cation:H+ antiporter [Planctomycetota bacterium]|jgi:cation:H+ antiporter